MYRVNSTGCSNMIFDPLLTTVWLTCPSALLLIYLETTTSTPIQGIYAVNTTGCIIIFDPPLTTVRLTCPSAIASKFLVPGRFCIPLITRFGFFLKIYSKMVSHECVNISAVFHFG